MRNTAANAGQLYSDNYKDSLLLRLNNKRAAGVREEDRENYIDTQMLKNIGKGYLWNEANSQAKGAQQAYENVVESTPVKVGKVLSTELTPAGDIMRIGMGIDPYSYKELTTEERLDEIKGLTFYNFAGKGLKVSNKLFELDVSKSSIEKIEKSLKRYRKIDAIYTGLDKEFNYE